MSSSTTPPAEAVPTRIVVFQQHGSGEEKIAGIRQFGHNLTINRVIDINTSLPAFIDEPLALLPTDFTGDVVLSFLKHVDLVDGLAKLCADKSIPLVASGQKAASAITPFTCCGLGRTDKLGAYGEQFGVPEFRVTLNAGRIASLEVLRGASCGATWLVVPKIVGLTPAEAESAIAREVQYLCKADPSNFDPITGKSALHHAGHLHIKALNKALNEMA